MTGFERVSTLDYERPRPTIAVDPGVGNTAVGIVRGTEVQNCAVIRPRIGGAARGRDVADPMREIWEPSGELVSLLDPRTEAEAAVHGAGYRTMAEQTELLKGVARRVGYVHDFLARTYTTREERDAGLVHVVVEVPEGVPRGWSALTKSLTLELAAMIAYDLDCDTLAVEARLCAGERHRADRNPTGKPQKVAVCYPEMIHTVWPDQAAPDVNGNPVAMLPNEDVGKRGGDELEARRRCRDAQAMYDISAFYWMSPKEREAMKLAGKSPRRRRSSRRVA